MCFTAGTKVHTDKGVVDIEKIQKGDKVLSQDPVTKKQAYKTVVNTIVTKPTQLYHLSYRPRQKNSKGAAGKHLNNYDDDDEEEPALLTCTGEHPFYLVGKNNFVQARLIVEGDEFLLADGKAVVVAIDTEESKNEEGYTTYNIEVEDYHTYFVGLDGVWVHNASTNPCGVAYDIYHYYRKIRKEGTLGPIQAYEKLEKSLPWVDKQLMGKVLEEVLPEIFIHTPVDNLWTKGSEGTAALNIWKHYVDHVLRNKSFAGLEEEFPHITNAAQYVLEAKQFIETASGSSVKVWIQRGYVIEAEGPIKHFDKICKLDINTGHFAVKWLDDSRNPRSGRLASFFRANRQGLTWQEWAQASGYPIDKPF